MSMKTTILGLFLIIVSAQLSFGQAGLNPTNRTFTAAEQEIINLSKDKLAYMSIVNGTRIPMRIMTSICLLPVY